MCSTPRNSTKVIRSQPSGFRATLLMDLSYWNQLLEQRDRQLAKRELLNNQQELESEALPETTKKSEFAREPSKPRLIYADGLRSWPSAIKSLPTLFVEKIRKYSYTLWFRTLNR